MPVFAKNIIFSAKAHFFSTFVIIYLENKIRKLMFRFHLSDKHFTTVGVQTWLLYEQQNYRNVLFL